MTPNQKLLLEALEALKKFQDNSIGNLVIAGAGILGGKYTQILCGNGFLEQVIKGWYIPTKPEQSGTSTAWYASYWNFIEAYMNDRFKTEWSLSPELSLSLHGGACTIPKQIIIRSPKGSNNIVGLPYGCSIIDMKADISSKTMRHPDTGVNIYPVEEALVRISPDSYVKDPMSIAVCLSLLKDESELVRLITDDEKYGRVRIGRVVGALRAVGNATLAERALRTLRGLGYVVAESNPFQSEIENKIGQSSPYAARIELLWATMKEKLLSWDDLPIPVSHLSPKEILASIEANYVNDSYNSLSIEGYRVTEELIARVRDGSWDPENNEADMRERNALAARGYYQAYQAVKESIKDILGGRPAGEVYSQDYRNWHFELFEPSVNAGILKPSDLAGFRNHPVYIRNSMHVPVGPHAVTDCMAKLDELMEKESHPLVRAILGHFFFTYIHPYMDGNGRTARFIMNSQLSTAGYGWLVINEKERDEYMDCLEKSSINEDIGYFGRFIVSRLHE